MAPNEIIPVYRTGGRPRGVIREYLPDEKVAEIPILDEILRPPHNLS